MKAVYALMVSPILFGMGFIVLFVTLVGLTLPQLPAWARGGVSAWMLDEAQSTGAESGLPGGTGPEGYGNAIPSGGYDGPQSFACLLPPTMGHLTDRYGTPRGRYTHTGIDYGTYYQAVPVRTPMGGQVVFASWSQAGYGNLLIIENAGYQVYLAHNTAFYVAPGQVVEAGQVVALSGTTGVSTGYHVHFEVRIWVEGIDGNGWWAPRDPNRVFLPGQTEACDWYGLATLP